MHTYTSDTHVTPHLKILATGLRIRCVYKVHLSPALSRNSALQCVKLGNALKRCDEHIYLISAINTYTYVVFSEMMNREELLMSWETPVTLSSSTNGPLPTPSRISSL